MRTYIEEYKYWSESEAVDAETKKELEAIAGDEEEIKARFDGGLTFGTSGLRGIMKAGTKNINVYTLRHATQGLANLILKRGGQPGGTSTEGHGVVIAHDSRNNSVLYAEETAKVLAANGIKVYFFDNIRPTPELSFAVRETGSIAGVNITASHNTKEFNGYKVYWADGAQLSPENAAVVAAEFEKIDIFGDVKTMDFDEAKAQGLIEVVGEVLDEKYIAKVIEQSVGDKYIKAVPDFRIVYTPFHGAGYKMVPEVLKRLGYTNIIPVAEQMITDGDFPTVKSPNPENSEGFALALDYAKRYDADIIIGTDPDSDRCGAVVKKGYEESGEGQYEVLSGNQMGCIILDYLITVRRELGTIPDNAAVCKSIVSTVMAERICEANGISMHNVLTGFKFIGEKIKEFEESGEYNFFFGFEESIGFLAGTYTRDKDAVVAAMLMAEVGCYYRVKGMTVYDGLQELYKKYGYYKEYTKSQVFEGFDAQERMANVMRRLRANPPQTIGGLKVESITDYLDDIPGFTKSDVLGYKLEDGCALTVRPSGTEPKVKAYIMTRGLSEKSAQERCDAVHRALAEILS